MVESFWSIPSGGNFRAPLTIMREQATALTEQTRGALVGSVEVPRTFLDGTLEVGLSITVPALNDYKYQLLTYTQPVTMYPGKLEFELKSRQIQVKDEQEFLKALKDILSSEDVKRLLSSLLVQANAA